MDQIKTNFYSNLNGTSKLEVLMIVSPAPLSFLLYRCLALVLKGFLLKHVLTSFILEFVLFFVTMLCSITFLSDKIVEILLSQVLTLSLLVMYLLQTSKQHPSSIDWSILRTPMVGRRWFVTNFRVFLLIVTAISILAVDFQFFPRRFAKSETYGTGLMDIAVGCFIFANAVVSPEARGLSLKSRSFSGAVTVIFNSVKTSLPLFILGFLRLLSVKGIDYHEHVTEYGVHWNFFFTLAVVRVSATIIFTIIPRWMSGPLGLTVAIGYQLCLSKHGLKEILLHGTDGDNSREGFVNANREGLLSCVGYTALFLMCIPLGQYVIKARETIADWLKCLVDLLLLDGSLWFLLKLSEDRIDPVSRRMANLSFLIWNVAFCLIFLILFLAAEIVIMVLETLNKPEQLKRRELHINSKQSEISVLIDSINMNQLFFFLAANLLTGIINLSCDTITQSTSNAFIILVCYLGVLCSLAVVLHTKHWRVF